MNRVLLITNIPASYRVDFFNLLSESNSFDCHFLFIPEQAINYKKNIWAEDSNVFFSKSRFIETRSAIRVLSSLIAEIIKLKPQKIIIGGIPWFFPILLLFMPLLRYKIFCWWAGNHYTEERANFARFYRKLCAKYINGYFFYSNLAYKYFTNEIRQVNQQYKVIGNNTRLASSIIGKISSLNAKSDSKGEAVRLISIGFLEKSKNIELLLHALKILQARKIELHTVIIGDGPEASNLKDYILNEGLRKVHILGTMSPDEILIYLKTSTIFVHPSYIDRWPQVYNEAAFCGLPILISDRAGVSNDYTNKFKDNALFDPFNPIDLADKIEKLILNEPLCKKLGVFAQKNIIENDGYKVLNDFNELLQV